MILIAHRGNINGKIPERENQPDYIDEAIFQGYDVEIDLRLDSEEKLYLGHDECQYHIDINWLLERKDFLWIHCKTVEGIVRLKGTALNYFFHDTDDCTLTSQGYIWAFPGKQPIKGSIAAMPDNNDKNLTQCLGICSDYVKKYK